MMSKSSVNYKIKYGTKGINRPIDKLTTYMQYQADEAGARNKLKEMKNNPAFNHIDLYLIAEITTLAVIE